MPTARQAEPSEPGHRSLHLNQAELLQVMPSRNMTQLMSVHTTLLLLLEGGCLLKKGRTPFRMRTDTVYICPPGSTYELTAEQSPPLVARLQISWFEPAGQGGWLKTAGSMDNLELPEEAACRPGFAGERFRRICACYHSADPLQALRAQFEVLELLIEIASNPGKAEEDGVERARRYIEEHAGEALSTEHLASVAGLSPRYFADVFKKAYGKSPLEYITANRMAKAKRLMLASGRKLKDIAHEIGYSDEFYFSRVFKKEYGFSPSHYISRRKRRIAAYGGAETLGYLLPLELLPYAAPLHPKWTDYYLQRYGPDIPFHLDYGLSEQNRDRRLAMVAETKPELILCPYDTGGREYERLSSIACTMRLPEESPGAWRAGLRHLAKIMGMETEAAAWIGGFETRTELARQQLSGFRKAPSLLFARMSGSGIYSLGGPGTLDYVYNDLGFRRPAHAPEDANPDAPVRLKEFDAGDVDAVCLLIRRDTQTLEYWNRLCASPYWLSLNAVKEKRIYLLSSSPWREYSPVALDRIREELVSHFAEKSPSRIRSLSMEGGGGKAYHSY